MSGPTPYKAIELANSSRLIRAAFVVFGDIYPCVRTTQRQKFMDPRWSQYAASQADIRQQVSLQMAAMGRDLFEREALGLGVFVWTTKALHKRDLSNIFKAAEDALQRVVYPNDAWIDCLLSRRWRADYDVNIILLLRTDPLVQVSELATKEAMSLGHYYLQRMRQEDLR